MNWKKLILLNAILIIIGFFAIIWGTDYMRERQVIQDEKRRLGLYDKILDGASTGPTQMTIDYSKQISKGSPLIFGGTHTPPLDHQSAWDQLEEAGVTSIRVDFGIDRPLPKNITLEDYKNNKNNIQDPKNWDQNSINNQILIFENAKKRGMKVIGIVDYAPSWLTYSNTFYGVPKDWNLFKDIVKKIYKTYRQHIDYLEIWNEPNLTSNSKFLNIAGTELTKKEAYEQIYLRASAAIREVDAEINDGKKTPIGGPVSYTKDEASFLEPLLKNPQTSKNLDFVSYHQYEPFPTESNIKFKELLEKYNKQNLPIFLTEWSYSSKGSEVGNVIPTDAGITYAGNMFLNFIDMGIKAANYHSLTAFMDNKPYGLEKNHAFYKWENGRAELLPLARTWRILSKQMKLGKGESRIFGTQLESRSKNQELRDGESKLMGLVNDMLEPEKLNTIGFKNIDGEYGMALVNSSDQSLVLETTLSNTTLKSFTKVRVYYASAGNDAKLPVYEGELKADKNGTIRFPFYIPRETVVGMVFTEDKAWYEQLFD